MKQEAIAKRYVQSLVAVVDSTSLDNASELLALLSNAFENPKFSQIMNSDENPASVKLALILEMVSSANSSEINNLIKLLSENGRLLLIPAISKVLKQEIASMKRSYNGRIYSTNGMDQASIDSIARDLGNKVGASISLQFVPSSYDGVRVEVDGLNIEIDFSKSRLNAQMIEHILKAI